MNYDQENHKKNQQILPFMKPMSPPKKGHDLIDLWRNFEGTVDHFDRRSPGIVFIPWVWPKGAAGADDIIPWEQDCSKGT
jgi:hypothetical protein